jgi:hypothetical protein
MAEAYDFDVILFLIRVSKYKLEKLFFSILSVLQIGCFRLNFPYQLYLLFVCVDPDVSFPATFIHSSA